MTTLEEKTLLGPIRPPGVESLWQLTLGVPDVKVAVLDGPVDLQHECLQGAILRPFGFPIANNSNGAAERHGTHVASLLFAQHGTGAVRGMVPAATGLLIPVFTNSADGNVAPCSQMDLARAISWAVDEGADLINISGGQWSETSEAHPYLKSAVDRCREENVLIVAAAGNEGCRCLNLPGAMPSVLVVGAMDDEGRPLPESNWGDVYQNQGVLAQGLNLPVAEPGDGTIVASGTSMATPIVTGLAALLASLQLQKTGKTNLAAIRAAILESSLGCDYAPVDDCRRLLAGRLNVEGALQIVEKGLTSMATLNDLPDDNGPQSVDAELNEVTISCQAEPQPVATQDVPTQDVNPASRTPLICESAGAQPASREVTASEIGPASCGCTTTGRLVFALGMLGHSYRSEARRDSIWKDMAKGHPDSPKRLFKHLKSNPSDAPAVIWTLNIDSVPIYAIEPRGPYAHMTYEKLVVYLTDQVKHGVERVAIPGHVVGMTRLLNGAQVPIIAPESRGMSNWSTAALFKSVVGEDDANSDGTADAFRDATTDFLERVYNELRNLGTDPRDRALNYAATNALTVAQIFQQTIKDKLELDHVSVERSPVCRAESDCWDVKLFFFNPAEPAQSVRRAYRFTVDVSDVVPVMVGEFRSWHVR